MNTESHFNSIRVALVDMLSSVQLRVIKGVDTNALGFSSSRGEAAFVIVPTSVMTSGFLCLLAFIIRVLLHELAHCLLHCSGIQLVNDGEASPRATVLYEKLRICFRGVAGKVCESGLHFDCVAFAQKPAKEADVYTYSLFLAALLPWL